MKIVLILFVTLSLHAGVKQKMFNLYQNKKYEDVCNIGHVNFSKHNRDEEFVSLYAFACLKSDYIDRLATPIAMLKYSKEARSNAAYFATILMQKKLLYHAIVDNYPLEKLNLPTTSYVLSKVFDLYTTLGQHKQRTVYLFEDDKDAKLSYKLYLSKGANVDKVVIEELYDSVLITKHTYW